MDTASVQNKPRVYDIDQLAALWRLDVRTVYRLLSMGSIPAGFKVGRNRRWLASDIDKWMETNSVPSAR